MKRKNNNKKRVKNYNESILTILKENKNISFNHKQIASKLGVNDASSRNQIIKNLHKLAAQKQIEEIDRGKFKIIISTEYFIGKVDMASRGNAYVMSDNFKEDIFISSNNRRKALHGDTVELYIYKRKQNGKLQGEITKIIKRERSEYVGIVQMNSNYAFVVPDSNKMPVDVFIPLSKTLKAENGDKVLVQLQEWPDKAECPNGVIKKILGKPGEHNTEIHSILAEYGLPYEFPPEVEEFANNINTSITKEEILKRRDMRNTLTFTIDPKDAKDFDDALSFKELSNGNYEIGIHIADVSHYLHEGTVLDDEAYKRATSVYLVDRVVPMLPEVLSNNACSLRPNEEKLTFSAVFEINNQAIIQNEWFGRTVTYSDARFAYEEAQHIIETELCNIPKDISITNKSYETTSLIKRAIIKLNELSRIMRKKRMKAGAISFDKVEVKFDLDKISNPIGVFFKTSKDANKLIEEFMLLANKKVAEFIGKQSPQKTFIYRTHDEPNNEKLQNLQRIVSQFGHQLNFENKVTTTNSLNTLLKNVKGTKEQNLVDTLTIRCMSKAEYSTKNIGHYGLAFNYYSHFTSPIRRYPDVMAHRLLQHYLDGNKTTNEVIYEEKCKHSSNMETLATKAERDSIKYMQVKYMQNHKEDKFLGVISGVTEWGMYVEIIENKCEGMIRIRDIKGDFYKFDTEQYALIGDRTKTKYQLGDQVEVQVKKADLLKRHLDFVLS
jgi:ribonuclease R/exosome complex exonuclease DIS3/RRP44